MKFPLLNTQTHLRDPRISTSEGAFIRTGRGGRIEGRIEMVSTKTVLQLHQPQLMQ